ncbi:hypothetical protein [Paenibacillus ferrarius]|uniref:hypothetical protein n=1 Tax=Paenibacillus ferrarius TaxID=1469647 RepID=UPI003D2D8AC4
MQPRRLADANHVNRGRCNGRSEQREQTVLGNSGRVPWATSPRSKPASSLPIS